jgi:hypothetical protein
MATIIEIETTESIDTNRAAVIARIKTALKARSGKSWSVTGGRGSSYGWITGESPKARLVDGYMPESERAELAALLGLDSVHMQGLKIASSNAHYREYVQRAEGKTPTKVAEAYWA